MQFEIKLFGHEAQLLGKQEIFVQATQLPVTCEQLSKIIAEAEPKLTQYMAHCRLAVNHEYAGKQQAVSPDDEIALIGAVAGG